MLSGRSIDGAESYIGGRRIRETNKLETLIICIGSTVLSPIWLLFAHSVFGRHEFSLFSRLSLACGFAFFFLNREFGVELGGGAFDDVPQYVYLFNQALDYTFWESLSVWTFEPGFMALSRVISYASDSSKFYVFLMFFLSTFALISGVNILSRDRVSIALLSFFVLFGVVFYSFMHHIRQPMSISFLIWGAGLYSCDSSFEKKFGIFALLVSGLFHTAAIPLAFSIVVAQKLWVRSRVVLLLGILIVFPFAMYLADTILALLVGYSSRIQIYISANAEDTFRGLQLAFSVIASGFLLRVALQNTSDRNKSSLYYVIAVMSIGVLLLIYSGQIPDRVLSRQLIAVLAVLSVLIIAALGEIAPRRTFQYFIVALLFLRFLGQLAGNVGYLEPFKVSGAVYPWGGIVFNLMSSMETKDSNIPSWFGWGGLE